MNDNASSSSKESKPEKFLQHFPGHEIYQSKSDIKVDDPKSVAAKPWHKAEPFSQISGWLSKTNNEEDKRGVFFTVNELDQSLDPDKKRTKKMWVRSRAVWVEDDEHHDTPRTDWPIKPNLIVNSSPGHYHYYWLTSTENKAEWEAVMDTMVSEYGCDKNARDLARVMRIPGFYHLKRDPHLITFEVVRSAPYSWEEITAAYPSAKNKTVCGEGKSDSTYKPRKSVAELNQDL